MQHATTAGMLQFVHLPSFAGFLLGRIDDYTNEFISQVYKADIPLLKHLQHLSEEERFQFSKKLNIEFLNNLFNNNAAGHLEIITSRWLSNAFENIGRYDVHAQDVTLVNYTRSKAQKKFINQYTKDPEIIFLLHTEIDELSYVFNTRSTNDYLDVLKEKIEEEAHFNRNILEASPGIIFIYDIQQDREIYINGRVEEITGFSPGEVNATRNLVKELTHTEDMVVVSNFLHAVIAEKKGKIQNADYRFRNKKAQYQWMRCYAVVYKRDAEGNPLQILGSAYDISNEKETAFALVKREQQLLEAQSIGKIGSFDWDIVNDISISTPEVLKIFESDHRKTFEEMREHTHPDDVEKIKYALTEAFTSGVYACEYRYKTASGMKVIDAKGVIRFDENRKPLSLVGTIQDITERKKIEKILINSKLELERSNEQLQEFAFVASHDLKEPLRKIAMFSNIIMTTDWDDLPERTKTNIEKISESAMRMQRLIEGILTYSSSDAQQKKEHGSLETLFREAMVNLEYKIQETGAEITTDGLPAADVIPFQVQQLFQNLIGNALKFSKKLETPRVRITHSILKSDEIKGKHLNPSKKYLQITVADNGIGFSKASAQKIFGLFQRLHGRSDYEGSGLGLAICKRIVENHGGAISATSELGVGSTFRVVIPYGG